MTDLHTKLREIIDDAQSGIDDDDINNRLAIIAVPRIEQAFKDAGYVPYKSYGDIPNGQKPPDWWSKTPTLMTGREWYKCLQEVL